MLLCKAALSQQGKSQHQPQILLVTISFVYGLEQNKTRINFGEAGTERRLSAKAAKERRGPLSKAEDKEGSKAEALPHARKDSAQLLECTPSRSCHLSDSCS